MQGCQKIGTRVGCYIPFFCQMDASTTETKQVLPTIQLVILSAVNSLIFWKGHLDYKNSFYSHRLGIAWRHFHSVELPLIRILDSYWLPVLISLPMLAYALLIIGPKLKGNRKWWIQVPYFLMMLAQSLLLVLACFAIYIIFTFEDD